MPTCYQIIPCLASSMGNFIADTMEWNVMVIILIVLLSIQWDSLRFDAQSRDSNGVHVSRLVYTCENFELWCFIVK